MGLFNRRKRLKNLDVETIDLVDKPANEEHVLMVKSAEGGDDMGKTEQEKAEEENKAAEKDNAEQKEDKEQDQQVDKAEGGAIDMLKGMVKSLIAAIEKDDKKESLRLAKQVRSGLGKLRRAGVQKDDEEGNKQEQEGDAPDSKAMETAVEAAIKPLQERITKLESRSLKKSVDGQEEEEDEEEVRKSETHYPSMLATIDGLRARHG